ncbi:MAG: glycosyltransferase [Alphaproteobacteria bacterium]
MTKLMQIMAGAKHGGAEAFFTRLAPALSRVGVEQEVIIRSDTDRAAALRTGGVTPLELRLGGMFDITSAHRVKRAIRQFAPEVVLTWMNRATAYAPLGPHITAARLGGYYKVENYRQCDHLIGNTQDICDYLIKAGWPKPRVHHIPNFVDDAPSPPVSRADFNTPDDATLLLAMGRLHINKGFDTLVDALRDLPNSYLWIAGEGPLRERLERQAAQSGVAKRTRFLGWRDDGPALLATADVFVCPSRHEPLGNVVIEAWAHKCPVVAAESEGPGTLIEHGRTGLLTPVDDSNALARAITRVTSEQVLAQDLAAAGQDEFRAKFNQGSVVSRYLRFFDAVTT